MSKFRVITEDDKVKTIEADDEIDAISKFHNQNPSTAIKHIKPNEDDGNDQADNR